MPEPDPTLTPEAADESAFMEKLSAAPGGALTNPFLMRALRWEPSRYWQVRNRLEAQGRVQRRLGGPGGTTFITIPSAPPSTGAINQTTDATVVATENTPVFETESALYAPMLRVLEVEWIGDQAYDSSIVRNTALGGGRNTGGTWTRPDFCVVAIRKFKFLRDPVFDVISFEIKPNWAISVGAYLRPSRIANTQLVPTSFITSAIRSSIARPKRSE
jgi:hypothetical protein